MTNEGSLSHKVFYEHRMATGETAVMLCVAPTTAERPPLPEAEPQDYPLVDKAFVKQANTVYVFLVDRSGSMAGPRMEVTKEALTLFLQSLHPEAWFSVVSFGSKHNFLEKGGKRILSVKNDSDWAINKIKEFEASYGGTEILEPLTEAINLAKRNKDMAA